MLRGNLSTRPFYNEGLVTLVTALVAILVVGLTYFNVQELRTSSATRSDLQAQIAKIDADAAKVNNDANALRQTVDRQGLKLLALDTREANDLIDRRTFSWIDLIGVLEKTEPIDLRLVSIAPRIDRDGTKITMSLVTRNFERVEDFTNALWHANGMFYSVFLAGHQLNDDGTDNVMIEAYFLSPSALKISKLGKGRP